MYTTSMVGSPNSVFNITWDSAATAQGIERAAKAIVAAVDKGAKQSVDESKDSRKTIDESVKRGSEKVVDAIGRINNSNVEQAVAPSQTVEAICSAFADISESSAQLGDFFYARPTEWKAVGEMGHKMNEQLGKLVESMKQSAESGEQLRMATTGVAQASQWVRDHYSRGCDENNQNVLVGNSAFNALWQQYGGK